MSSEEEVSLSSEEEVTASSEEESEEEGSASLSEDVSSTSGDSLSMSDEEESEEEKPKKAVGKTVAKTTTRGRGTATARGTGRGATTTAGRGSSITSGRGRGAGRGTIAKPPTPVVTTPIIAETFDPDVEVAKLKRLVGETQEAFLFRRDAFEKVVSQGNYDVRESTMYSKMITNFVYKSSIPSETDKEKMEHVIKDCDITI